MTFIFDIRYAYITKKDVQMQSYFNSFNFALALLCITIQFALKNSAKYTTILIVYLNSWTQAR